MNRTEHIFIVFKTVIFFLAFYFVFQHIIENDKFDFIHHLNHAVNISRGSSAYPANFLLYALMNLASEIPIKKMVLCIILSGSVVFKYILTFFYFNMHTPKTPKFYFLPQILSFLFIFISIFFSVNAFSGLFYAGNFFPNVWHNSTIIFVFPFSLMLAYYFYKIKENDADQKVMITTVILIFLNAIIKPSFLFIIISVAPLYTLLLLYGRKNYKHTLFVCLISLAIITIQYIFLYIFSIGSIQSEKSSVSLQLFKSYKLYNRVRDIPTSFILSFLFPLAVGITNPKVLQDGHYRYGWLLTLTSLAIYFILSETGPRQNSGNFYWQIVPSAYILLLATTSFIIKRWHAVKYKIFLILIFLGHFLYGLFYFYRILNGNNI